MATNTTTTALVKLPNLGSEICVPDAWLEKKKKVLALAGTITFVSGPAGFDNAADALSRVTKCSGDLEKERTKFGKPFLAIQRAIKEMCDGQRATLEAEKLRIKKLCNEYAAAQELKAREEKRAQEAADRAAAAKLFAEQEEKRKAEESLGLDQAPEPIVIPEAPAPVEREARSSSARVTKRVIWREEHTYKIPHAFLVLDTRKVNEYMREHKDTIQKGIEEGGQGREYIASIVFQVVTEVSGRG